MSDIVQADTTPESAFAEKITHLESVTGRRGVLSPTEEALIRVGVVGNPATYSEAQLREQTARALDVGASVQQVLDVLKLVSVVGVHSMTVGLPVVVAALRVRGDLGDEHVLDDRRLALRAYFEQRRGYWHESWDDMLACAPDMFESYLEYSSDVADRGGLGAGFRELVYIAVDAVAAHMYVPGLEIHVKNALELGESPDRIIAAIEVASMLMPLGYRRAAAAVEQTVNERKQ